MLLLHIAQRKGMSPGSGSYEKGDGVPNRCLNKTAKGKHKHHIYDDQQKDQDQTKKKATEGWPDVRRNHVEGKEKRIYELMKRKAS